MGGGKLAILQRDLADLEFHAPLNQFLNGDLIRIAVAILGIGHQKVHPVSMRYDGDSGLRIDVEMVLDVAQTFQGLGCSIVDVVHNRVLCPGTTRRDAEHHHNPKGNTEYGYAVGLQLVQRVDDVLFGGRSSSGVMAVTDARRSG